MGVGGAVFQNLTEKICKMDRGGGLVVRELRVLGVRGKGVLGVSG